VREDAAVEDRGLLHFLADGPIRIDPMHRGPARIVVSRQGVGAATVERYVDRTRRQCGGRAVHLQRAIAGIDAQRAQEVFVALDAERSRTAVARRHIEK